MAPVTSVSSTYAIDRDGGAERRLVFLDEFDTIIGTEKFDPDRVTLFFREELYDWYGRKVQLPEGTTRIVRFFSSFTNGDAYEQFIVQKENGRFGIAYLRFEKPQGGVSIPDHKDVLTGHMLGRTPVLDWTLLSDFARIDTEIVETPVFLAFSSRLNLPPEVFCDVNGIGKTVMRYPADMLFPDVWHCIVDDRRTILNSPRGTEIKKIRSQTYLDGEIEISSGGKKMTSYVRIDDQLRRVSTDVAVINHMQSGSIYWYLDP